MLLDVLELDLVCEAPRSLEMSNLRLWLRIDGVFERVERLAGLIVEESALLEEGTTRQPCF